MTYDNNAGSHTLYPRTFYVLYIRPNNNGTSHFIFKLSTKQILATTKYQPISVPKDLIEAITETDSVTTKIQIDHFDSDPFTAQDDHINNTKDNGQTQCYGINNSEDESYDELDSSQQLDCMELNTTLDQENQIILSLELSESISVSVIKTTGIKI